MAMSTQSTHEIVRLPSGLRLETSLATPGTPSSKLAVFLHPWSRLGGNMNDPVLIDLKSILLDRGYHVLRYNSRGVGRSSGWPSLAGTQEAKDLQELVQWAIEKIPSLVDIVILGYSYGALIASLFPLLGSTDTNVSHVLLSYPLSPRSLLTAFRGSHYTGTLASLLQNPHSNVLVVYSDQDEFTAVHNYDAWTESLRREGGGRGKLVVVRVDGTNHFWTNPDGRQSLLSSVGRWIP